jgi:calcineurin-like phosphoesterase family protein
VVPSADASVSVRHPDRRDAPARVLRLGGRERWQALLRFRVPAAAPITGATLRLWAQGAPTARLAVHRLPTRHPWREGTVTFARLRRQEAPNHVWNPLARAACGRSCPAGRWIAVDVSAAVRRAGTVSFVLTSTGRRTLLVRGRVDRRRAPRLLLHTAPAPAPGRLPSAASRRDAFLGALVPGAAPLVAAAGDIACVPRGDEGCAHAATSELLLRTGPAAVLALGDQAYEDGTLAEYRTVFDPAWGRLREVLHPVPGNHEYHTPEAGGYFDYFNGPGAAFGRAGARGSGWYSFDVGSWHVVALNSNCGKVGGCQAGSPQERWLRADLAAHPAACTLAFWHHPRFSSGPHGDAPEVQPLWQALEDAGADVVLSGHDHDYERFAPQTAAGVADAAHGLRQFVAGTGGRELRPIRRSAPNSEVHDDSSFGVLLLTLAPSGYDWRFVPAVGAFTEAGSAACH